MMWNRFLISSSSALLLLFGSLTFAQETRFSQQKEFDQNTLKNVVQVDLYLTGKEHVSGYQLDIPYDPDSHQVILDDCLNGLPDSHRGAFASCKALPEKGFVRVVVMDLGLNRDLPKDTSLGSVTFITTRSPAANRDQSFFVPKNVLVAGDDGKQADFPASKVFRAEIR